MKKFLDNLKSSGKLKVEETDIHFWINDQEITIKNGEIPSTLTLARFLRTNLGLTGTKISCNQAGCGVCIVTAYVPHPNTDKGYKVISVNSCVTPVLSCDGWQIVTVEGLGSRKDGMHPIQERLAAFHGTQCGFCSPGMVMQMNALLEKNPKATMNEIEHILDGNICRCTGYRAIHDAFKSFASDTTDELKKTLNDIEDAGGCQGKGQSICPRTGKTCGGAKSSCKTTGKVTVKHQVTPEGHWYMPEDFDELMSVLSHLPEGTKYRLVGGNTGTGIYNDGPYDVYVDIKKVNELKHSSKSPLELGGGMVLNDVMELLKEVASDNEAYKYGQAMYDHLSVVASTGVRNTGTLAGNLMLKHEHQYFPSDCFLMLETLGANVVVASATEHGKEYKYSPEEWLKVSMDKKVVKKFTLPALSKTHVYRTFKITPRLVHAHAYVNAGFLLNVSSKEDGFKVKEKPTICFGGIAQGFVHASKTEAYLNGKSLKDPDTLKGALKVLNDELKPHEEILEAAPGYRKNLAQGLLYKTFLGIINDCVDDKLKSGGINIKRGLSDGKQFYKTDEEMWPMNKAVQKIEGNVQCTGEAQYADDIPRIIGELHAAVVQAKFSACELDVVDPSPALALPGVRHFIDHTCVPGMNSWVPWNFPEEIFSSGKIHYAGQSIGLILADTPELALKATELVKVTYKNKQPVVVDVKEAIKDSKRVVNDFPDFFGFKPAPVAIGETAKEEARDDVQIIEGDLELGKQYHFFMETLTAVCRPMEDNQLKMYVTTQWMDFTQNLIMGATGLPKNKIDIEVRRLGGGYGGKCTPSFFLAVATAVACRKVNKPIRFVMDLKSTMSFIGMREQYFAQYKAGVDKDGLLQSIDVTYNVGSGWTASEMMTLAEAIPFTQNAYNAKAWNMIPKGVLLDISRGTATRAPGTSQGHAIMENIMDHIAAKLGMDPLELRIKNFLKEGDNLLVGHPFHGVNPLPKLLEQLSESSNYKERKASIATFNQNNRWKKRGMSMVPMRYHIHSFAPMPFYVHISVFEGDGSIAATHGGIEMGQGINTKVAQTIAKQLNVPVEMVVVKPSDTLTSPNNIVTGGSTTSEATCNAAKIACDKLKERMKPVAEKMEAAKWHEIVQACFFNGVDLCARHMGHSINDKLNGYTIWGAVVTEVEIDVLTGERNILRTDLIEDTGATINPEVDIGQIEGGYVFALGWWMTEQIKHDPVTGQLLTADTWDYKVPSCYDIPQELRTTLCETNRMEGTLSSKATGEPSMLMGCSVAFALRNALSAVRQDLGIQGDDGIPGWVKIQGPLTVEKQLLASGVTPAMFTI